MSGGQHDYLHLKVLDFIESVENYHLDLDDSDVPHELNLPLRARFLEKLVLAANAMQMVEKVDSGDCSPGDEEEAIRKFLASDE